MQPPLANPGRPQGFQNIPAGAPLPQIIRILNYNFNLLAPQYGFNGARGAPGRNANEGNWTEVAAERVTQKVRVFHMDPDGTIDRSQFIDFKRINRVVMEDKSTGATWVWNRGSSDDGLNLEVLSTGAP